jgi:glycosyltransferase involved in cell wall biosynthesis
VGFVGRFVEKKGLDVLLAAWPAVRAAVPEACLRLLGYGPLEAMVRRAGDGVEVVAPCGDAPAAQVRDALRQAAVVVAPSRTAADGDAESLLLVNLEAQATGRPVVTTRHGGIPEFVDDGRTGVLVPEGDAYALAGALVSLLLDAGARARMAEAGPRWAARFDVRTSVAALDGVYDEVMSVAGAMS